MRDRSRFSTALILALLLVGAPVPSDSASLPEITTIGAGGDACRRWTETAEQSSSRYQYRQWLFVGAARMARQMEKPRNAPTGKNLKSV